MKFNKYNPNSLRLVYDLVMLLSTAFVAYYFFSSLSPADLRSGVRAPIELVFLMPFVVVSLNFAFGIFGRNKMASGLKKAGLLFASFLITYVAFYVLGLHPILAAMFALPAYPILALPRYFLNLSTAHNGFGSRILNDKGAILIVGGAGYIGTHVVDVLLQAKYKVRVLDRLMYNRETIKDFEKNPNFEFVEGDATDISKLVTAMSGVNTVVHLAGLVGDPACAVDKDFTRHTNVISTRMVKDVALSAGVSRFIFASSCSVYGASDEVVSESSSLNPVSLYAVTKIDSEKELLNTLRDDFHVTVLRFATVFGHSRRPRFDLVGNLFSAQAFNDGVLTVVGPNQWRPFVHCRDLAKAIEKVIKAPADKVHGQVFNVGDNKLNMTIGDLADKVAKVSKSKGKTVELNISDNVSDRRNYRVDFSKIRTEVGFEASYTIEAGVEEILNEFAKGTYNNYKDLSYSNFEMTKKQVGYFYDPMQTSNLYRPVSDVATSS